MKRGGAAQIKFENTEDKARFATYLQKSLDHWRYAQANRTWPALAQKLDVGEDQITKYLRARAVPSKPVLIKMIEAGVFNEYEGRGASTFLRERPWASSEPDAGVMERAASNREKKKQPTKKQQKKAAAPAPAPRPEVAEPEFEVAAPDVYDVIAQLDIPAKAKMQLSALVALAEAGGVLDVEVKVRAR